MSQSAQVTFFFNLGDLSWTEAYYWQRSTGVALAGCKADCRALVKARRQFLSQTAALSEFRISEIALDPDGFVLPAITRNLPIVDPGTEDCGAGTATVSGAAQYAQMILFRCTNQTWGVKRSVMTRGSPTSFWAYDPAQPFGPAVSPLLKVAAQNWSGLLAQSWAVEPPNGVWSIKAVARDPAKNAKFKVLSVAAGAAPNANWVITMDDTDVRIVPGAQIKVGGMRGMWSRGLNRVHTVKAITGDVVTLVTKKANDCSIDYNGKGYVRRQLYQLFAIDSCEFVRYVIRDTGVTARATRGRSRNNPANSRYN